MHPDRLLYLANLLGLQSIDPKRVFLLEDLLNLDLSQFETRILAARDQGDFIMIDSIMTKPTGFDKTVEMLLSMHPIEEIEVHVVNPQRDEPKCWQHESRAIPSKQYSMRRKAWR